MTNESWSLVSSHGTVLFVIATNPECTIKNIADDLCLTKRTVWGVIGDLRRKNMLLVRKEGRRHHYSVNLDAEFAHPTIQGVSLGTVLRELVRERATPRR